MMGKEETVAEGKASSTIFTVAKPEYRLSTGILGPEMRLIRAICLDSGLEIFIKSKKTRLIFEGNVNHESQRLTFQ